VGDQGGEAGEVVVTHRFLLLAHPHLDFLGLHAERFADERDGQSGDSAEVGNRP